MVLRRITTLLLVPSLLVVFAAPGAAATEPSSSADAAPTMHLSLVTFEGQVTIVLGRSGTSTSLSGTSNRCMLAGFNLVSRLRFATHCDFSFKTNESVFSSPCSGIWTDHESVLEFHNPVSGQPTQIPFSTTTTVSEGSGSGVGRNTMVPALHVYYQIIGLCPGAQDTHYAMFTGYVGAP